MEATSDLWLEIWLAQVELYYKCKMHAKSLSPNIVKYSF